MVEGDIVEVLDLDISNYKKLCRIQGALKRELTHSCMSREYTSPIGEDRLRKLLGIVQKGLANLRAKELNNHRKEESYNEDGLHQGRTVEAAVSAA